MYLACNFAADSFFLLSGFFVSLHMVKMLDSQKRRSLLQLLWFYVYRLGRILPTLYVGESSGSVCVFLLTSLHSSLFLDLRIQFCCSTPGSQSTQPKVRCGSSSGTRSNPPAPGV